MGVICELINCGSASLPNQEKYRQSAIAAGLNRAIQKNIGDPQDLGAALAAYNSGKAMPKVKSVDVREFQPILDAGAALDQWNTAALAAVGTAYSIFQAIPAPVNANNKLVVVYGVQVETTPLPVSRIIIRTGGAAGPAIGMYDLEQMVTRFEGFGYFSTPCVIDPSITWAVQVLCRIATGALARVQLAALIFEPADQTVVAQR